MQALSSLFNKQAYKQSNGGAAGVWGDGDRINEQNVIVNLSCSYLFIMVLIIIYFYELKQIFNL